MSEDVEFLYRVEGGSGWMKLHRLRATRRTEKGYWVESRENTPDKMRFVLKNGRKKYAHETLDGAIKSFVLRKRMQIRHLCRELEDTIFCLPEVSDARAAWEADVVKVMLRKLDGEDVEFSGYYECRGTTRMDRGVAMNSVVASAISKIKIEADGAIEKALAKRAPTALSDDEGFLPTL
jgi:hypothetical protein